MTPAALALFPIDAVFAQYGRAASYQPPPNSRSYGAAAIACTAILDRADQDGSFGDTRIVARSTDTIEVRAAEVAAPEPNGVFTIAGTKYSMLGAPKSVDPEQLVWLCVVTK